MAQTPSRRLELLVFGLSLAQHTEALADSNSASRGRCQPDLVRQLQDRASDLTMTHPSWDGLSRLFARLNACKEVTTRVRN